MSHVDEGTLHAYLDNELPAEERTVLEAHLADCAACRDRLAEERALARRAGELLGLAQPPRRVPARPPLLWRLRVPLTWAATVVIALGIGYYAGGRAGFSGPDLAFREAPEREPDSLAPAAPTPVTEEARSDDRRNAQEPPAPPPPAPEAVAEPARRELARAESKIAGVRDAEPAMVIDGAPAVMTIEQARDILGTQPVEIADLTLRALRATPDGQGVIVEQALDSASVIQLIQRPGEPVAAARRDAPAPAAPQMGMRAGEHLARYVGSLRVEIAGPLGPDSLNRLLEQLRPMRAATRSAPPPR
ncbi:MAG: anti-sigma factor family protein [Gemmatimonadales bacterium]